MPIKISKTLVIIESPYAGQIERNTAYARLAVRHSVLRGEAPIASHLLFTQPDILDDSVPVERALGISAGLAWRQVCHLAAFYIDYGWSSGMINARALYEAAGIPFEFRTILDARDPPCP